MDAYQLQQERERRRRLMSQGQPQQAGIETAYARPQVQESNQGYQGGNGGIETAYAPPVQGGAQGMINSMRQGQDVSQYRSPGSQRTEMQVAGGSPMQMMLNRMQGGGNVSQFATQNRYGQQRGGGYIPPRRSLGGGHATAYERMGQNMTRSPRTAGLMYGGRPAGGGYGNMPTNQNQALTRPGMNVRSAIQRPYGGAQATIRRRPQWQYPGATGY